MPSQAVLILVLLSALPLQAQDICCQVKTVAGANAGALAGTYNFLKNADTKDPNCSDGCIYTKVGSPGEEYCFTPVPEAQGAVITEEQCAAPTGTTAPAGPQTTASSDQLRQQAEAAAARVQENQKTIEENVDKIKKGEDATTTIAEINAKLNEGLTTSSVRLREKRQAGTTVPVAKPTNCGEFETTFEALLDLAIAVDDSNIFQIQVYVIALKPVDVGTICNANEKAALAGKTNAKATTATGKTKEYIGKKNSETENLKAKVNEDLDLQKKVNEELKIRDQPTIPLVASTYAIQPTTPNVGGGETSPGAGKPEETSPGGGQPQGTSPGGGQPQGTLPGGAQPQGTSPGGGQPQGTTPGGGQPLGTTPGGGQPQGTSPGGGQPQGTTPGGGQPQGTSPGGAQPQGTSPGGGQPQGTTPGGGQPQGTTPGGGQPQGTSPGGGQPQGTTPGGGQPQVTTPSGSNPQETPGGTPKMSTAKPGRMFLHNRRRRGVGEKQ